MLPPLINGSPHSKCSHMLWWQAQSVCFLLQSYSLLSSLLVEMASHLSFQKCWTFISPDSLQARDNHGPVLTNEIWRESIRSVWEMLNDKRDIWNYSSPFGFPGGSEVKTSACNAGDLGSIPGSGRSPGEGNGNPLQYSCLENPMDGGAWWATVNGVAKGRTRVSDFTFTSTSCFEWSGIKMWCLALKQSFCQHEGRVTWIAKTWTHADIIDLTLEPPTSHLLFN